MGFFNRRSSNDDTEPKADENEAIIETEPQVTTPPPPPPKETRSASARMFDTALGAGSNLEGTLTSDGNVRLDGVFKGTLNIKENILVGVTAQIEADIAARNVSVAGVVRGDVSGEKVHLLATAKVWGDITATAIITEDGAFIEGRISMAKAEAEADDAPPLTAEDLAGDEPTDD
ncbi:MAG: polymer-forming cytoskeletal protein [Chloroflexota bacterium]